MNTLNQSELREDKLENTKALLIAQKELENRIKELINNEAVQEYIELTNQYEKINRKFNILQANLKNECSDNNHNEVLLFIGYDKDDSESRTYMLASCLNCGQTITLPKGNMEQYLMLNGKESFPSYFPLHWTTVRDKLMKEYHSLQECYEENQEILKETVKSKKIIYKAMKKRYEENTK